MRCIVHMDLDCFYAQVEALRLGIDCGVEPYVLSQWGNLIAVGYPARKFGIKRMESLHSAIAKCPHLKYSHVATYRVGDSDYKYHPNPDKAHYKVALEPYRNASKLIFDFLGALGYDIVVEKGGIDEMFLDVTDVSRRLLEEVQKMKDEKTHPANVEEVNDSDSGEARDQEAPLLEGSVHPEDTPKADDLPPSATTATTSTLFNRWDPSRSLLQLREVETFEELLAFANTLEKDGGSETIIVPAKGPDVRELLEFVSAQVSPQNNDLQTTAAGDSERRKKKEFGIPHGSSRAVDTTAANLDPSLPPLPESLEDLRLLVVCCRVVKTIRNELREKLGYYFSAGIAHNRMLAKVLSAENKPNHQTLLPPCRTFDFMVDFKFQSLRGLGGKLGHQVSALFGNGTTCGDLWQFSIHEFVAKLGKETGEYIYKQVRGAAADELAERTLSKSITANKAFGPPTSDMNITLQWVQVLASEIVQRVEEFCRVNKMKAKTLRVWVGSQGLSGTGDFMNKSGPVPDPLTERAIIDQAKKWILARRHSLTQQHHQQQQVLKQAAVAAHTSVKVEPSTTVLMSDQTPHHDDDGEAGESREDQVDSGEQQHQHVMLMNFVGVGVGGFVSDGSSTTVLKSEASGSHSHGKRQVSLSQMFAAAKNKKPIATSGGVSMAPKQERVHDEPTTHDVELISDDDDEVVEVMVEAKQPNLAKAVDGYNVATANDGSDDDVIISSGPRQASPPKREDMTIGVGTCVQQHSRDDLLHDDDSRDSKRKRSEGIPQEEHHQKQHDSLASSTSKKHTKTTTDVAITDVESSNTALQPTKQQNDAFWSRFSSSSVSGNLPDTTHHQHTPQRAPHWPQHENAKAAKKPAPEKKKSELTSSSSSKRTAHPHAPPPAAASVCGIDDDDDDSLSVIEVVNADEEGEADDGVVVVLD